MPRVAIRAGGPSVDVPRASLAILQFDAEASRAPAQDLSALAALRDPRWSPVRWFNERDFGGMLGGPSPYGATVLGYNAVAFSADVRAQLDAEPPSGPVVILHQRDSDCYGFLRDRLALKSHRVPLLGDVSHASVPSERRARDEILLRFPQRVLETRDSLA